MKRRLLVALSLVALVVTALPTASAGPTAGGLASDNVEYVTFVPFEPGSATGATVVGKYMYLTSWKNLSVYDISDPESPQLLGAKPLGFMFENENVSTNGEILLFSEELPGQPNPDREGCDPSTPPSGASSCRSTVLHIWNIEDKTNPVEIAQLFDAGNHTTSCVLKCTYAYGSSGTISDLRDPNNPEIVGNWEESIAKELGAEEGSSVAGSNHDVTEVRPGIVLTSTNPMFLLDARKDPAKPKVLANGPEVENFIHSAEWPRKGRDRFLMTTGETWTPGPDSVCSESTAGFATWDAKPWVRTHVLKQIDIYRPENGTTVDGKPIVNAPFGCSTHWFDPHPKFNNGGLVAVAMYNHGTRFIDVNSKGKISEAGWFLPAGGGTSAAYFINDEIVYAVDYQRGLDVLRWTGKI